MENQPQNELLTSTAPSHTSTELADSVAITMSPMGKDAVDQTASCSNQHCSTSFSQPWPTAKSMQEQWRTNWKTTWNVAELEEKQVNCVDTWSFNAFMNSARNCYGIRQEHSKNYIKKSHWNDLQGKLRDVFGYLEIWRSSFNTIEGNFGRSILSYFRFVRWLFVINLLTSLVVISTIVLPQALVQQSLDFADTVPCSNSTLSTQNATSETCNSAFIGSNDYEEMACCCSANYSNTIKNTVDTQSTASNVLDFFQGTGWMEISYLFIGYYYDKTQSPTVYYYTSIAFLVSTAGYFLTILFLMVQHTSSSVKARMVETHNLVGSCFSVAVFSGWDHSLTSKKAAKRKHKQLYDALRSEVAKKRDALKQECLTKTERCGLYARRLFVLAAILALLAGAFALIIFVVSEWIPSLTADPTVQNSDILMLIVQYLHSITLTVLNAVLPMFFIMLISLASLSPEGQLRSFMISTVFLRLASIALLVVTSFVKFHNCDNADKICGSCVGQCWESYFGRQIYTLVLTDFFVVLASTFLIDWPRRLLVDKCSNRCGVLQKLGRPEFITGSNALSVVYSQTLCWIGAFFSPLIPVMTVIKLFIFFYVHKVSLSYVCVPSSKSHRMSQSSFFFFVILMISFVLCTVGVTFAVTSIQPSQSCGPFRVYSRPDYYMFTAIVDAAHVDQLPSALVGFVNFVTSSVFFLILIAIFSFLTFYFQVMAAGKQHVAQLLEGQLIVESHDKQFLRHRVKMAFIRGDFELTGT